MSDRPPETHVNIPLIIVASTMFIGLAVLTIEWVSLLTEHFMRLLPW